MQYLYWTHPQIYNYVYLANFDLNFEIQVNLVLPTLRESLGSLVLPQGVVSLLWELCHVSSLMLAVELEASAPSTLTLCNNPPNVGGWGISKRGWLFARESCLESLYLLNMVFAHFGKLCAYYSWWGILDELVSLGKWL